MTTGMERARMNSLQRAQEETQRSENERTRTSADELRTVTGNNNHAGNDPALESSRMRRVLLRFARRNARDVRQEQRPPTARPPSTSPPLSTELAPAEVDLRPSSSPSRTQDGIPFSAEGMPPFQDSAIRANSREHGRSDGAPPHQRNAHDSRVITQGRDVESGVRKPRPSKFLFCVPRVNSRRVRSQMLTCFVSGMFLTSVLAVYLGLALTNRITRGELTIMIILLILSATMFFCYSVIRLCILMSRGDRDRRTRFPQMMGTGGYVVPPKPIQVLLTRDEEAAGIESEALKSLPPAYGLWRESVRVDPNRLFWQRNETAGPASGRPETRTGPRPPSYASDDGISYVIAARPRSVAPPPRTYVGAAEVQEEAVLVRGESQGT